MRFNRLAFWAMATVMALALQACGDDDGGSEADRAGIGSDCAKSAECPMYDLDGDGDQPEKQMECLLMFSGGYCGVEGCTKHEECPEGSMCVTHDDGANYCFLSCTEKADCNTHRSTQNEANCSSSVTFVDNAKDAGKSCVPPSGGI